MSSYMRMCCEHGGEGAVSGSKLYRRLWLRLGQRGEGTGQSVVINRESSGLVLGPVGLDRVSALSISVGRVAVERTGLDSDD